ncbi:MAG: hypothetical protein IH951_01005 [Bacteroidetes bacterium]|nr:hypothetical protein [Bacteroidota bacterium]
MTANSWWRLDVSGISCGAKHRQSQQIVRWVALPQALCSKAGDLVGQAHQNLKREFDDLTFRRKVQGVTGKSRRELIAIRLPQLKTEAVR